MFIHSKRGQYGEERYEKVEFQSKVRDQFMILKKQDDSKIPWHVIDARKSIIEIQQEIADIVEKCQNAVKNTELRRLW